MWIQECFEIMCWNFILQWMIIWYPLLDYTWCISWVQNELLPFAEIAAVLTGTLCKK